MSEEPVSLYILLLILCLVLSAFFSGSEATLLSLQRIRLQGLLHRRVPGARRVARMVEHPEQFLPTILLGNNLVNTAAAVLGTAIALAWIASEGQAVVAATAAVTLMLLIFGEVVPKTIGVRHAERTSFLVVPPLEMIRRLLFPLVWLLQLLSRSAAKLFGGEAWQQTVTEEELKLMISMGRAAGTVESQEAEMLEKVFHFGDREVREIMTPRTEVVWVERGMSLEAFLDLYTRYPYSRFPIYEGSMDNVVGILSVKDVLRAVAENRLRPEDEVTTLSRNALFVPETKPVSELLQEFQALKNNMAVIVDEFGGVDGVATLTQLLEVVMGPLEAQEGMPEEEEFKALNENTFEVDGGAHLDEVNEKLGLVLPVGEYETIAGFILDRLGHIPAEGESWESEGVSLVVTLMQGVKIEKIRVTRAVPTAQPEDQ